MSSKFSVEGSDAPMREWRKGEKVRPSFQTFGASAKFARRMGRRMFDRREKLITYNLELKTLP